MILIPDGLRNGFDVGGESFVAIQLRWLNLMVVMIFHPDWVPSLGNVSKQFVTFDELIVERGTKKSSK